jgi:hypothetical protein
MAPLLYDGQKMGFDVTIPCTQILYDDLIVKMKGYFKKWVFQKETYENGDHHWQIRGWLIHKKTCKALFKEVIPNIPGHWSMTSSTVHLGPKSFNYVMKEDTRVEGPWKDTDIMPERPPLTWQLEEFMTYELRPYQQFIFDRTQIRDMRHINIVYDPSGHCGKSLFCEFLEYQGVAFECPPFRSMDDMMEFVHGFPAQSCYMIDMPRGMKKDKLGEFYSGVEILKNGVTWDTRYHGKKRRMNRPNIWIFTNTLPVMELMSVDRWNIYTIDTNTWEMKDYVPQS